MDEKRMSLLLLDRLPSWAMTLSIGGHLAAGILLGLLYFRAVWWDARRFALGGRATTTIALMIGRFTALGGLLILASLEGALPLLVMALGVLIARSVVMRSVGEAVP
jgi:F1F0 ATPase subunit 2